MNYYDLIDTVIEKLNGHWTCDQHSVAILNEKNEVEFIKSYNDFIAVSFYAFENRIYDRTNRPFWCKWTENAQSITQLDNGNWIFLDENEKAIEKSFLNKIFSKPIDEVYGTRYPIVIKGNKISDNCKLTYTKEYMVQLQDFIEDDLYDNEIDLELDDNIELDTFKSDVKEIIESKLPNDKKVSKITKLLENV